MFFVEWDLDGIYMEIKSIHYNVFFGFLPMNLECNKGFILGGSLHLICS